MDAKTKRLHDIAAQVLRTEAAFTKREIIQEMINKLNIPEDRATSGFNAMKEAGAIKATLHPNWYYLASSTPF